MPRRAFNRRFAKELRDIIDERFDGNMTEYCRSAKTAVGTVGHYLSGKRYPTPEKLEALLKPLHDKDEMRLLEAFLMDLIPPALRSRVKVHEQFKKGAVREVKLAAEMVIPARTRKALEYMGVLASDNAAVRLMIEQTAKALGWGS
jgi:hypothetical protein